MIDSKQAFKMTTANMQEAIDANGNAADARVMLAEMQRRVEKRQASGKPTSGKYTRLIQNLKAVIGWTEAAA